MSCGKIILSVIKKLNRGLLIQKSCQVQNHVLDSSFIFPGIYLKSLFCIRDSYCAFMH